MAQRVRHRGRDYTGRILLYLAACGVAGVALGRAFGAFARASFHYPFNYTTVSPLHQAVLAALDVIEWPSLFILALVTALLFRRWLHPGRLRSVSSALGRARAIVFFVALAIAWSATVPATRPEGRWMVAIWGVAAAWAATWLIGRLWRDATTAPPFLLRRVAAQLPVIAGHLAVSATASGFLGFRGESALVHAIMLMVAAAIFAVELACAMVAAAIAQGFRAYK